MINNKAGNPGFLPGFGYSQNMPRTHKFCIIAIKDQEQQEPRAVLKALFNHTFIIEKPYPNWTVC